MVCWKGCQYQAPQILRSHKSGLTAFHTCLPDLIASGHAGLDYDAHQANLNEVKAYGHGCSIRVAQLLYQSLGPRGIYSAPHLCPEVPVHLLREAVGGPHL